VHDSVATGSATATTYLAGGLVGVGIDAAVLRSVATGAVSAPSYVGALIGGGNVGTPSHVIASFGDSTTHAGLPLVGDASLDFGGSLATSAELQDAQFFADAGWNVTDVWSVTASGPELVDQEGQLPFCERYAQQATAPFTQGVPVTPDGTKENPYRICDVDQLDEIASETDLWSAYIVLEADLDLSSYSEIIGTSSTTPFSGTLDGNGRLLTDFNYTTSSQYPADASRGNGWHASRPRSAANTWSSTSAAGAARTPPTHPGTDGTWP
jgi:hypothetical protein